MSQHIESLFSTSVQESVQAAVTLNKPLFVYLSRDSQADSDTSFLDKFIDSHISAVLKDSFVLLKLVENTTEYGQFNQIYTRLVIPSFNIIWRGKVIGEITESKSKHSFRMLVETIAENLGGTITRTAPPPSTTTTTTSSSSSSSIPSSTPGRASPGSIVSSGKSAEKVQEEHELNVKKHKLQVEQIRKDQLEEKKRLRELLKADQRERELLMKEQKEISPQLESTKSNEKPIHTDEGMCMLSIKLFDGSSIKQEFKSEDTLHDVRTWLDIEIGIIPSNETMPAFAKSSYPHPVNYAFHRPVLPRITYSEEQETQSLLELELTPRSALILKPIYHEPESTSGDGNPQSVGYVRRAFGFVGTIGRALYSFFDYGTGPAPASYQEEDHDDPERPAPEVTLALMDDIQQIGLGHPAHTIVMDDRTQSQSSLFNIEHPNIRATREIINSRPTSPRLGSAGSDSNRASAYPSRSSTPRPSGVNRIQMFQDEDKKGVDTYNGNSVNLNERDDNDSE